MKYDNLGNRMKGYESVARTSLMRRTPVILRIDGKAFHTFTRGLVKPFDAGLALAMIDTTKYLCDNIQGAVFGYTQSDEISILIQDWKNLNTDSWFGNDIQKMTSVSASMATAKFNSTYSHPQMFALFDSRAFNVPMDEVVNYFVWRQQDCIRNSISSCAQAMYSHKQLHCKSQKDMLAMMRDDGLDWDNNVAINLQRGTTILVEHGKPVIDLSCPIFHHDVEYIRSKFIFGENDE